MIPGCQAALPFPHAPRYDPATFIAGPANAAALAWIADPAAWPAGRLAVHGPAGSGKTHLLHVFAARHGAALFAGGRLALPEIWPGGAALAIDEADRVAEPRVLLHWLNMAADRRIPLLLAGREPPARWPVTLPDLASRLRAMQVAGLREPDDALLRALLARLLAERQLAVAEPVQSWLLTRLPRTGEAMREAAWRLDRAGLEAGRPITRGLAASVLNLDEDAALR